MLARSDVDPWRRCPRTSRYTSPPVSSYNFVSRKRLLIAQVANNSFSGVGDNPVNLNYLGPMYALINWWQYNWQPYQRNAFGKFYRFPYTSSPISGVTWAPDSRSISTPSLPLNGIWQLRVSDLSVGLHTKSTLNTFVVQLYPHRVIFVGFKQNNLSHG